MEKKIVVDFRRNEVQVKEDGFEKTVPLGVLALKDFGDDEIEQLVKTRLVESGFILDDIKNYKIAVLR